MTTDACECLELGPRSFDETFVGVDPTRARFGEVNVRTCRACGRRWLHYRVEYEAFTASGRWYAALLPQEAEAALSPKTAVALLERQPWHVYGGSYFRTAGRRGAGPFRADV